MCILHTSGNEAAKVSCWLIGLDVIMETFSLYRVMSLRKEELLSVLDKRMNAQKRELKNENCFRTERNFTNAFYVNAN
jgi:hypothetical protein